MKTSKIILAAGMTAMLCACGQNAANPFFSEYDTPYQVPPFDKIELSHVKPAFEKALAENKAEIEAIINCAEEPNFENTILPYSKSGELLSKVMTGFRAFDSNEETQAMQREMSPIQSKHRDDIRLNPELFARIKAVYENREALGLDEAQTVLTKNIFEGFERSGANLPDDKKEELRKVNAELSELQLLFSQNVLKETNAFKLVVDDEKDLAGLPQDVKDRAAQTAAANGMEGKWVFTPHKPSCMPFLQYAENRELRRQMFLGYTMRGDNGGDNDNKEIIGKIVNARLRKAQIMGYEDYAAFKLADNMADTEEKVYGLLDQLWTPALAKAKEELADIKAEIAKEGGDFEPEGWDWTYYFEKAKKAKFDIDEEETRPYFEINNVREGIFYVANRLYGLTFVQLTKLPKPNEDMLTFLVKDKDGSDLAIFYCDYFTRAGKKAGAWCGGYRGQKYEDGKRVIPIVTNVFNFSKPVDGQPCLLTADEAETMFHEFGHALDSFFTDLPYQGMDNSSMDFVELPSQINEHWAFEPEVLKVYAKHYQTGEVIPQELVEKISQSGKYGQGFATTEYLAASLLDMDYHILKTPVEKLDVDKFESESLSGKRGLIRQIPPRYRSTYFSHTFEGGYDAGYYSYIWAEVLDCDAFQAFVETGDIFNQEVAAKFRKEVLSTGGYNTSEQMYLNFRGKSPSIDALLNKRGLK